MTKKALSIIRKHHAIKNATLQNLYQAYKQPSENKRNIVKEIEKEMSRKYGDYSFYDEGVFSHNAHFFSYAYHIYNDKNPNDISCITVYITQSKVIEVEERPHSYIITEYDNINNHFYYRKLTIVSRTDEP